MAQSTSTSTCTRQVQVKVQVQVQDETRQDKTRQDTRLQKTLLEAQDDNLCHVNDLKMIKYGPKLSKIVKNGSKLVDICPIMVHGNFDKFQGIS